MSVEAKAAPPPSRPPSPLTQPPPPNPQLGETRLVPLFGRVRRQRSLFITGACPRTERASLWGPRYGVAETKEETNLVPVSPSSVALSYQSGLRFPVAGRAIGAHLSNMSSSRSNLR